MPSEREIDNYIDKMNEENVIYVEKEIQYAEKCHKLEEELGCPLDVVLKALKHGIYKVKAFDLINEKDVDVKLLKWAYPSVEAYNVKVRTEKDYWWRKELTKEEFEFIGRMVGAE